MKELGVLVLVLALAPPVTATGQRVIDATRPPPQGRFGPQSGHFSGTGYRLPVRVDVAVRRDPADRQGRVIVEFTLTNSGTQDQTLPVSPNPRAFEPGNPAIAYSVTHLALYITSDRAGETIVAGGANLYGSQAKQQSLVKLAPGESIHVLAKEALRFPPPAARGPTLFTGHAMLNVETITQVAGKLTMDSREIGSAASPGYTPESLFRSRKARQPE